MMLVLSIFRVVVHCSEEQAKYAMYVRRVSEDEEEERNWYRHVTMIGSEYELAGRTKHSPCSPQSMPAVLHALLVATLPFSAFLVALPLLMLLALPWPLLLWPLLLCPLLLLFPFPLLLPWPLLLCPLLLCPLLLFPLLLCPLLSL